MEPSDPLQPVAEALELSRGCMRALVAVLMTLFAGFSHAQTLMPPDDSAKFEARLRGWARTYYPAMTSARQLPDDIVFAFLVDQSDAVLQHTAGLKGPIGVNLADDLARFFPGHDLAEFKPHGAACFLARANEPRYCVYYATVPK